MENAGRLKASMERMERRQERYDQNLDLMGDNYAVSRSNELS